MHEDLEHGDQVIECPLFGSIDLEVHGLGQNERLELFEFDRLSVAQKLQLNGPLFNFAGKGFRDIIRFSVELLHCGSLLRKLGLKINHLVSKFCYFFAVVSELCNHSFNFGFGCDGTGLGLVCALIGCLKLSLQVSDLVLHAYLHGDRCLHLLP